MTEPAWFETAEQRRRRKLRIGSAIAVLTLVLASLYLFSDIWLNLRRDPDTILRRGTLTPAKRHDHVGKNGAVASDVELCSQMGIEVLKSGGNAADAAVTVALCIGSINFQASGIGGGGFATVRDANGTAKFIDFRETAPMAAHKHMYDGMGEYASKFGALAAGVPGELAGLDKIHKLFGSGVKSWSELVMPVAKLNKRGFKTSVAVAHAYDLMRDYGLQFDEKNWGWMVDSNGKVKHHIERPAYAHTLKLVAKHGASAFYDPKGPIAPHIVETLRAGNGSMSLQDLKNYTVLVSDPLDIEFCGVRLLTGGAPSSGPALAMGIQAITPLITEDLKNDFGDIETQRLVEVLKWMAAARSELGDPNFSLSENAGKLLSKEWIESVRNNISDSHTLGSWRDYHPSYEMNDPKGTAHFSIIDKDGMAVALTTTVNLPFGNLMVDEETGIVLNSEMDDFARPETSNFFQLAPSKYNFIAPGKRPLSSTVPSIVAPLKGGPALLAIGAAGGSRIMTAVFQALVRLYGYDETLLDAIARPRIHHQLLPEVADIEFGMPASVLAGLRSRGHNVTESLSYSAMSGVQRIGNKLHAVSDYWRKGGDAAAY